MNPAFDDDGERRPDEFEILVQREIDGEISPEDEARLQQLLAEDAELERRYREDRALSAAIGRDRDARPGPPEHLAGDIVAALRREEVAGPAPAGRGIDFAAFARPLAAAAVLLVLVAGGFWAGRQTSSAETSSFEREVVEKFRETVRASDLPQDEAERLLDQFRQERERLARQEDEGLRSAAADLEDGLEELISSKR